MAMILIKKHLFKGLHVLGWLLLGFVLLFYIPLTWNVSIPYFFKIWQIIILVCMMVLFYSNSILIVPNTIIKNKIGLYLIWIIGVIVVLQLVAYIYTSQTDFHSRMAVLLSSKSYRNPYFDNFIFMLTLLVLGISTSLAMLEHWQEAAQNKQKLEQDKTMAELEMLKLQINPHFFFNSLNSIYSLTYSNIEDSRAALHTLSRMMRYLLYSTEGERTSLLKEVDFMKDFIALMKLRANSKLSITTDFPEKISDFAIVPMLLLPFVENAFKHGVHATDKSKIHIMMKQIGDKLEFEVENTFFAKIKTSEEGGIGLTNTIRRLDLIYPDKHLIESGIDANGNYKVKLQITLEQ
ncbi:sensor histidine kinase [Flavobacterium algicola]|uniref:sensor histidine kinase n=1 Tax=Flavobacterium algicola TaxID=556529 RepID=UPI001EFE1977|nr:histidine kinase [Flavobacterium algicola]MCG9791371.1 histidine kinase [Flavobacterium algicola]